MGPPFMAMEKVMRSLEGSLFSGKPLLTSPRWHCKKFLEYLDFCYKASVHFPVWMAASCKLTGLW